MSILYFSPMLLGLNLLLAIAVAATALWAMTRPHPGPGFWMSGAWTLIAGVLLFMVFMVTRSPLANIVGNALQLAGEALLILGVFRFMGHRVPYWILPVAVCTMAAFNIDYWLRDGNSDFLMGVYSAIAGLLPLQAIWLLLHTRVEPATRPARLLVAICLLVYSAVTLWRGALGFYEAWLDLPYQQPHESFSYLLPYNLALPALVMGFVGMTLMTMQRILADSQLNARMARNNAARFHRLLSVSSGGIALVENGLITDCNERLQLITGRDREQLVGLPIEQFFVPEEQEQLLYLLGRSAHGHDAEPTELQVRRRDGVEFAGELTVSPLSDGDSGSCLLELRDVSLHKSLERELKRLARVDPLTGALNRRALQERLAIELARVERVQGNLAVAMLDLDHFKQINDSQGHQAGDQALCCFVELCQQQMRSVDALARFGGEEFVLLMPDTGSDTAMAVAERVLATLRQQAQSGTAGSVRIRASAGITVWQPGDTRERLLQRADRALYLAKTAGRDRAQLLLTGAEA